MMMDVPTLTGVVLAIVVIVLMAHGIGKSQR
jgi:hypothetical protein